MPLQCLIKKKTSNPTNRTKITLKIDPTIVPVELLLLSVELVIVLVLD